ncbi:hypothetical protein GH733_006598 [Mirounga leonina]|nr:hypothetical protein GH733_006598 [Mirounga leonina]
MMKFQILWRILMELPRMKQTELNQLLKKLKLEEASVATMLRQIISQAKKRLSVIPLFVFIGAGGYLVNLTVTPEEIVSITTFQVQNLRRRGRLLASGDTDSK